MEQKTQIWKYQRDFSYKEGVSTEGLRYDLRNDRAEPPVLLSDQQMNHFLAHGWLQLDTKLPLNYHQSLFKKFNGIVGEDNDVNPGNNLLPVVPELNLVFDDPVIKGALTSVLGKSYMMHPHRVLHDNPPGSEAQVWHHDSYWGYKRKVHNHHPWWVMIMYYPQDMFEEIGPTGVIPGTQYIAQRLDDSDISGIHANGKSGVCMMIHYDIWHRKMKNLTDLKRYMVKFEFIRMEPPSGITWNNTTPDSINQFEFNSINYQSIWKSQLEWLSGGKIEPEARTFDFSSQVQLRQELDSSDTKIIVDALNKLYGAKNLDFETLSAIETLVRHENEFISLSACYSLAATGNDGITRLIQLMHSNDGENVDDPRCFIDEGQKSELEMVCRNAVHGLVASGESCIEELIKAYESGMERIKKYVCFALGEIDSNSNSVLDTLATGCLHEDPAVRLNAVEALGLKHCREQDVALVDNLLRDIDDEVRFNAALALARNGERSLYATEGLAQALCDPNRYVYGYALEALERINTKKSTDVLIKYLKATRYCPYTTVDSLF